ncbi:MAG: LodA/GoxA family CTQ-dependent oxidase, partial [Bacteroidota bacterium]
VVGEITQSDHVEIEWAVHVANSKPEWFEFLAAMDIPQMKGKQLYKRNPEIRKKADRKKLIIDAGLQILNARKKPSEPIKLGGKFKDTPVELGQMTASEEGHLIFIPGEGISGSPGGQPPFTMERPNAFSNATDWYDDICDGPVFAKVKLKGEKVIEADSAWVISTPPNYAPDVISWRTMDDMMRQVFRDKKWLPDVPETVSFQEDVLPILARLNGLQWVNKSIGTIFGAGAPFDMSDQSLLQQLSFKPKSSEEKADLYQELRRRIYHSFRPFNSVSMDLGAWVQLYGDAFGEANVAPNVYFNLPEEFDVVLAKWVAGDFKNDYTPDPSNYDYFSQVPLAEQPEMLDRSAMHFCLADAFHPGCELTWPMRHATMYRAPYRIKNKRPGKSSFFYNMHYITTKQVLQGDKQSGIPSPLKGKQGPGALTRWMALPWQGDTAYCRSGYDDSYDPYGPGYWPARVPNNVLGEADYAILIDKDKTEIERRTAFERRLSWYHRIPKSYDKDPTEKRVSETMLWMVTHFKDRMGLLVERDGPGDLEGIPKKVMVESFGGKHFEALIADYQTRLQSFMASQEMLLAKADAEPDPDREYDEALHMASGFYTREDLKGFLSA